VYDIDVPDFSRSTLSMAGLLITSPYASQVPTANADPDLTRVLPASPAAVREFPRGDLLTVFTEVYDNLTRAPHKVAITSRVLADDGKVVFQAEDERASAELKGRSGGYGHTAAIPLKGLAPGRYVLRVEARILMADGPTTSREVEFRVR